MRRLTWVPPLAWMATIFVLSTDAGGADTTGRLLLPIFRLAWPSASPQQLAAVHTMTRKAAHATEYALLAALWFRALARGRRRPAALWTALAISVAWAIGDEAHQALSPTRSPSAYDVGIDGGGAVIGAALAAAGPRAAVDAGVAVGLWMAAIGGVAFGVGQWLFGIPGGWPSLTTPLALLALVARRVRQGPAGRESGPAR
jgi:VanZ family protein